MNEICPNRFLKKAISSRLSQTITADVTKFSPSAKELGSWYIIAAVEMMTQRQVIIFKKQSGMPERSKLQFLALVHYFYEYQE